MQVPELLETDDFIDRTLGLPLQILYRDENYVAVFKPAGLIVHRSDATLTDEPVLLQSLRDQLGCHVYPVHRLDQPTAGLILFGLNGSAAAKMVDLFTRRMVCKYYQALVCGRAPDSGLIDKPLGAKSEDEWSQGVKVDPTTREATTRFETLWRYHVPAFGPNSSLTELSLLEIKPLTGRSHQIRRHLEHIGHPVVGDHRHGNRRINEFAFDRTGVCRMLLTSMRLDFRHPYSGELQSIVTSRGSGFDLAVSQLQSYRVIADPYLYPSRLCRLR
jgi:tRNA pseudouridine65 synthase